MNSKKPYLLALSLEVIDGFADSFRCRTHGDNYAVCIGGSIVIEEVVATTRNLCHLIHILLYHIGHSEVERIGSLSILEVNIPILSRTTSYRLIGSKSTIAEGEQSITIYKRCNIFVVEAFDFLNFMRSAEAVEEVDKGNSALNGRKMSYGRKIHHLLNRTCTELSKTRHTCTHHVLLVPKDRKSLSCDSTSRYVENAREQLPGNLVHIGEHEQKPLRCRKGSSQSTGLQCPVHSCNGTTLALHFFYVYNFSEYVFTLLSSPFIYKLSHRRRWSDGVNSGYFAKHIGDVCCGLVTVARHHFLLFCHSLYKFDNRYFSLSFCFLSEGSLLKDLVEEAEKPQGDHVAAPYVNAMYGIETLGMIASGYLAIYTELLRTIYNEIDISPY